MNMSVLQRIPDRVRAGIYLALALVALGLGALQIGGVDALWGFTIVKALAVVGFLAAPFGAVAAANTTISGGVDSPSMGAGYDDPVTDGELPDSDPGEAGATTHDVAVWMALTVLMVVVVALIALTMAARA